MERKTKSNKLIAASVVIIVLFIAGLVLRQAKAVLFPFFLAIFLSFVLYPIIDYLSRFKVPKFLSIIVIIILTFLILYLFGVLIYSSGKTFASEFPKYGMKINSIISSLMESLKITYSDWDPENLINKLDTSKVGNFLLNALGPFFSFISKLFLVIVFLIFILAERGKTTEKFNAYFAKERNSKVLIVIKKITSQVQKYLVIKTIISLFTGVFATVVLLLFGVDFAILFGFLTFILNYIPNIGSIMATVFPVVIAVFQFETLWPAFWIMFILISVQTIMGSIIEPRLMGAGLGLSPIVVLFFLFFWGWLWGIPGMILAVPIAAIVKIVCDNIPELKFIGVLLSRGE